MSDPFFERPVLNSPYALPTRHWELDPQGRPTQRVVESRRQVAEFQSPIPRPRKLKGGDKQATIVFDEGAGLSTAEQQYDASSIVNQVRRLVGEWREPPNPSAWRVTPETARLLQYWRAPDFPGLRPFFCQVEALETAVWLTEVAPTTPEGRRVLARLDASNADANPGLSRFALKLATGAGKTTVMAMLIAWQTVNAARRPASTTFTRGFLVVAPGLTIKDRLRVLLPNDPENYYSERMLVPPDMLADVRRARIVVTNFHAFKLRERLDVARGTRELIQGRRGRPLQTLETEGQMIQRVMPELSGTKNVLVLNDEAHHCYREKPADDREEEALKGVDEKAEARENNEAARLWISGLEAVGRKLGLARVVDLSATPFFLRGSGYAEGTLFPWTVSDFSLMDAIECGVVKLPRVPVADDVPGAAMPVYRDLWANVRADMPKKGRGKAGELDPLKLPVRLVSALKSLYGQYEKTFDLWRRAGHEAPPCFIVVCQNTAVSKLVYDYVAGFRRTDADGVGKLAHRGLPLFGNFDEKTGEPLARPNTLLIDSRQLEDAEAALSDDFRALAADEIARFRDEIVTRTGDRQAADRVTDRDLLREVMNTVGKPGKLGGDVRCVVSVAMLTEGWDANTVTHVLGLRAFGTQLLCEQVVGRALRRMSHDLNAEGLLDAEYADVFGIPFDFAAEPVAVAPKPPRPTVAVQAVSPDRDRLAIRFPRVEGYRVDLPRERLDAVFDDDSALVLTPELVGPTETLNAGIIGQTVNIVNDRDEHARDAAVVYELAVRLLKTRYRDAGEEPKFHLFGQAKRIAKRWFDERLVCEGGTHPGLLLIDELADRACDLIAAGITLAFIDDRPVKAMLDPFNPEGSTAHVRFVTSKTERWKTRHDRCHVNWVILDSDWEGEFCRVVEDHPLVRAYVKNHNLGFEVPYRMGPAARKYRPDFIVLVDDGRGPDDPLHLIVEIKGFRGEDARAKKQTMDAYWIPGVNNLKTFGRWAFAEFTDVHRIKAELHKLIAHAVADSEQRS